MATHKSSALKSIVWRIMGVFVYASIFYLFTRKWQITLGSTLVHHTTFLLVFYLHERIYLKFKFKDQRFKKALKAITYEIILGMGLGGLIVYFFTGAWKSVTQITLTYTAVKLVMYYLYDGIYDSIISKYAKRSVQKN